jgi:diguanylate cyclase (GGDEF)-like protein
MLHWPLAARLYAGGALAAACTIVAASALSFSAVWVGLLTVITLYLGFRASSSRVESERLKARQMVELTSTLNGVAAAHKEINALYEIAQTISSGLTVSDTMALVSSKLSTLVPFSACALFLYSEQTEQLHCRFATGTDAELIQQLAVKNGQGLIGWVARNRRPLLNAQPQADLVVVGSHAPTVLQSALVCPLIVSGELIGALAVYHTDPGFYQDDHSRLLDRICAQAAGVIHNAIIFERTQQDSLTDPLTGLPNTRSLFQHMTRELARAQRVSAPVAVVVMDLDDFKEINDTYGHRAGDRALRDVGSALRTAIRPYDTCVRYAGDEFIVVLSGCGAEEADAKRRELQDVVARLPFAVDGGSVMLSISGGIAVYPQDGDTCDALLAAADREMYTDKHVRKTNALRRMAAGGTSLAS